MAVYLWRWLEPRRLFWLAAFVGASLVLATVVMALSSEGLILPNGKVLGGDFLAFWSAGRMTLDGQIGAIHDNASIYAVHKAVAPDLQGVYLWHHPPTFLLVAVALALLPYLAAAALWLGVSCLAYGVATRTAFKDPRALVFAFAAPAAAMQLGRLQTGLVTAALMGVALLKVRERPIASGAMIGLFALKPHIAVLFPLALATAGRWRAFAAAAVTAALLCGAAYLAFGLEAYEHFFTNLAHAQRLVSEQEIASGTYASLFSNLRGLGMATWSAGLVHGLSALAATTLVVKLWRRGTGPFAAAALAAGSALISPYLFHYDLTVLLVAAALLVRAVGWDGLSPGERLAVVFAWAVPVLILSIGKHLSLPLSAVSAWALIVVAWRRAEAAPAPGIIAPAGVETQTETPITTI